MLLGEFKPRWESDHHIVAQIYKLQCHPPISLISYADGYGGDVDDPIISRQTQLPAIKANV
jgi:hypothetical protein